MAPQPQPQPQPPQPQPLKKEKKRSGRGGGGGGSIGGGGSGSGGGGGGGGGSGGGKASSHATQRPPAKKDAPPQPQKMTEPALTPARTQKVAAAAAGKDGIDDILVAMGGSVRRDELDPAEQLAEQAAAQSAAAGSVALPPLDSEHRVSGEYGNCGKCSEYGTLQAQIRRIRTPPGRRLALPRNCCV